MMADVLAGDDASPERISVRRAPLALLIAIGGGALVFLIVPPLAAALGIRSNIGVNLVGNLLWLALAIGGTLLLGARLVPGLSRWRWAALPLGIGAFAAAIALVALSGGASRASAPPPAAGPFLFASFGLLVGAFAEEALFRGFLQPLLVRAWGAVAGVALAAAGFTIVHIVGGWSDPLTLVSIALAGLWFGLLALRTGGFATPFLAHAGWNWAEALLFGASPNPGHDPAGTLIDIELTGPRWLGGSGDGMNSALPTMVVLALLIAPLLVRRRRVAVASADGLAPVERAPMPELKP